MWLVMELNRNELKAAISQAALGLTDSQVERAVDFALILYRENALQNLTRISGIDDFIYGHLIDVVKMFHVEHLGSRVLDLGSGSGVPGLLAAAIDLDPNRIWFLCDSEKSKAEYLKLAAKELGLSRVAVFDKRADEVCNLTQPSTITARAVGKVEKIAAWIWDCSTWNNLVLFKSRGWEDEWKNAQLSKFGKKLTVTQTIEYSPQDKYRLLVSLNRK